MSTTPHLNSAIARSATLGFVPGFFMLFFTLVGLGRKVPPNLAGAMQHFAAGILLCTIGTELLPNMVHARGVAEISASGIGFFAGVAVLIVLGMTTPPPPSSASEHEAQNQQQQVTDEDFFNQISEPCFEEPKKKKQSLRHRKESIKASAFRAAAESASSMVPSSHTPMIHNASAKAAQNQSNENQPLLLNNDKNNHNHNSLKSNDDKAAPSKATTLPDAFPSALVAAVAIDSALDGLLIGISSAAGPSAGPMMSLSLTVEMNFLGLSLATALHHYRASWKSLFAAALGPLLLVISSTAGGLLSSILATSPVLFAGMLGFGTSALLFMVAEELLLEAHEEGEHVWWVDLQLYIGFFASVLAGKFVGGEGVAV